MFVEKLIRKGAASSAAGLQREDDMSVAKVAEISASSTKSFEDAVRQGIARASKTLDNIEGAWIKEQKVVCDGDTIKEYRVDMKITFVLKD